MHLHKTFHFGNASFALDVLGTPERPIFLAEQVSCVLGIELKAGTDYDPDEVADLPTGVHQDALGLTEHGVFRLVGESQIPLAVPFRKWTLAVIKGTLVDEKRALILENIALARNVKSKEGVVYVIRNKGDPTQDLWKCGFTTNLKTRVSAFGTSMPHGVSTKFSIVCINGRLCEKIVHQVLDGYRFEKEWFKVDLSILISCIKSVAGFINCFLSDPVKYASHRVEDEIDSIFAKIQALPEHKADEVSDSVMEEAGSGRSALVTRSKARTQLSKDPMSLFIGSLHPKPGHLIHTHKVLEKFNEFLRRNNVKSTEQVSTTALTKALEATGCTITKKNHKRPKCCTSNCRCLMDLDFAT